MVSANIALGNTVKGPLSLAPQDTSLRPGTQPSRWSGGGKGPLGPAR